MKLAYFSSPFTKARVTLTLWYCLILVIILAAFSTVLYTQQTRDYGRIIILRDFGHESPRLFSQNDLSDIQIQVKALKASFRFNLLLVDLLILIGGGGLGYILAGKTLEPIQKNIEQQKKFIADASHELRTPLAAITTGTEVALRSKNKSKEDYRKVLEQTHLESVRMSKLADELLMIARIETGIIKVDLSPQKLDVIAQDALDKLAPLFAQKGLRVTEDLKKTTLMADTNKLKQLIIIFLDNAIKFTPENGMVTVSCSPKPRPTLIIKDTGIGMKREEKEKIFERFYQADSSRSGGGAGLGLSIAKWILEMHKATIAIDSKLKNGTKITVTFPNM